MKLIQKEIVIEDMKQQSIKEVNSLKETVESLENLKLELEKPSDVSACFIKLRQKVEGLRDLRSNAPGEDVFSSKIEDIVGLYLQSDNIISLNSIAPYTNVQIEQENLRVQQDQIMNCHDKDELNDLLEERDEIIRKCIKGIRTLVKHVSTLPLKTRDDDVQFALDYLGNNFPHLTEGCPQQSSSLEKCIVGYKEEKSRLEKGVKVSRELSNEKSSKLFKALGQLQRECHCIVAVKGSSVNADIDVLMTEYIEAIDEETKSTKVKSL
jgi:hypothetical protein